MTVPVYNLALAPPGRMTAPQIVGSAVEGGRTLSGLTSAADLTGGGLVAVKYSAIQLSNTTPDAQRYWSWLSAYLAGGVRSILVPLLVDRVSPFQGPYVERRVGITHSTEAMFSTGAGYAIGNAVAWIGAAQQNAGTVAIVIAGGPQIVGGEWFEIVHPTRGSRAYCITEIDAVTVNADLSRTYTVGIRPPLRDAVGQGAVISFSRPKTLMRLAPGTQMPNDIEKYWYSTPEVSFIESFGNV